MGRTNGWGEWDEHEVGKWLKNNGIEDKYVGAFVDCGIKGRSLPEVISDEETLAGMYVCY
jgi:hypothetical protein